MKVLKFLFLLPFRIILWPFKLLIKLIIFGRRSYLKRKARRIRRNEHTPDFYLKLHYQATRNIRKLRAQLPTLNGLKGTIRGNDAKETRDLRKGVKSRISWIESKIVEEEFYMNHYLKLAKS